MEENKQMICDLLCEALKATRNHYDLKALVYDADKEIVTVVWEAGKQVINVAMDSGTAMIRDIVKNID